MNIATTGYSLGWILAGFAGQALFTARFLVQWIASERVKHSVVPHLFWYLSMAGGSVLLVYAIHRRDPVFIAGQATGLLVYGRNLWLILRAHRNVEPPQAPR